MDELAAQHATDEGQTVFRLVRPTELRENPSPSSPVIGTLPEGSLVTVKDDAGPFLYVLAVDGRLGYMPDTAMVSLVGGSARGDLAHTEEERSRRRAALVLLGKIQAEPERARQPPVDRDVSAGVGALVSAAIGLVGLLTAHAITGMTDRELALFFAYAVLVPVGVLPFAVATAGPKAPLVIYSLNAATYLAILTGYVAA